MKRTIGVIRKVDRFGRINVPREFTRIVPIEKVEIILVQNSDKTYKIEIKPVNSKEG